MRPGCRKRRERIIADAMTAGGRREGKAAEWRALLGARRAKKGKPPQLAPTVAFDQERVTQSPATVSPLWLAPCAASTEALSGLAEAPVDFWASVVLGAGDGGK